jgi:hypothetical protein
VGAAGTFEAGLKGVLFLQLRLYPLILLFKYLGRFDYVGLEWVRSQFFYVFLAVDVNYVFVVKVTTYSTVLLAATWFWYQLNQTKNYYFRYFRGVFFDPFGVFVYEHLVLLERQRGKQKSRSPEFFIVVVGWKNGSFLNKFAE